jgi:hypothetical protein
LNVIFVNKFLYQCPWATPHRALVFQPQQLTKLTPTRYRHRYHRRYREPGIFSPGCEMKARAWSLCYRRSNHVVLTHCVPLAASAVLSTDCFPTFHLLHLLYSISLNFTTCLWCTCTGIRPSEQRQMQGINISRYRVPRGLAFQCGDRRKKRFENDVAYFAATRVFGKKDCVLAKGPLGPTERGKRV